MLRTGLSPLITLAALYGTASLQTPEAAERGSGSPLALEAPWSQVMTACLTPVPRPTGTRPDDGGCRVQSVLEVGKLGDTSWFAARYLRRVYLRFEGTVDSISYDELVVLGRGRRRDPAFLRWHVRRERDIEFIDSVLWTSSPTGVFLEIPVCLNGTGGCRREYLLYQTGRWVPVAQSYVTALQHHLPPRYQLHKGQRLDLRTLQGIWPVAQPGDANCCPSYEVAFRVRLRGSTLELDSVAPLRPVRRDARDGRR